MIEKELKTSAESGHQISADYRRHFEEMRDSSVATKSVRGLHCPTRIGLLPALDSCHPDTQGKSRPCAHEEHERGGYRM